MKEKKKFGKLKMILTVLLGVIVLIVTSLYLLLRNEINTLLSIRKINDRPVYTLTYHGDYELNKYLETGVKDRNELNRFLNENLARGIGKYLYGNYSCSSFFAKTPEGDFLLARNLDTEQAIPCVVKTDSETGYKGIGVANLMVAGWTESTPITKLTSLSSPYFTFDGMNEYGVAACSLSVPNSVAGIDDSKVTLYDLTVVRTLIDQSKNVDEAIELLSHYNIKMEFHYPSHYMIADQKGNSAIVEYVDGQMQVLRSSDSYQIATNFLLYQNEQKIGYSSERYGRFEKVLSQTDGILSVDEALELLEANTTHGEGQWSVVYNLTQRTMTVEFEGHYETTYHFDMN